MNRSLDEIGLELVRIYREQTDSAIKLSRAVADEVDDGSEDIYALVVRTIDRLRKENAELLARMEGDAANAMGVINADSGYTDSDREVIEKMAVTLVPMAPQNLLVTAAKAAAVATFGTEIERAAWLRSRGWKQRLGGGVALSWDRDDTPCSMAMSQAVSKQLTTDLKPFTWMLKPEFLK